MIPLPPKAVAMWQNLYIASLVPRLSLTAFFAAVFFFFCHGCERSCEGRPGYEAT